VEETKPMNAEDLRPLLNARPFVPFRLHMDDGRTFEVRHPDLLWLGKPKALLLVLTPGPERMLEQDIHLSLLHIVSAEPLAGAAST
jgi:hypothetical protein